MEKTQTIEVRLIPESIQLIKMTDEEYFSEKYKDYISNSLLSLIDPTDGGSSKKYEQGYENSGYNESFELGSAVHAVILQPNEFEIPEIYKPTGKLGMFALEVFRQRQSLGMPIWAAIYEASIKTDYYSGKLKGARLKAAIQGSLAFYKERMKYTPKEGVQTLFLSKPIKTKYDSCVASITASKEIQDIFYPKGLFSPADVYNEYAILCEADIVHIDTGIVRRVKLKAKLDNFTIDHETQTITLNDLKTTSKPIGYFMGNHSTFTNSEGKVVTQWFPGSFQKYRYYRQLGVYLWLLRCAVKEIHNIDYTPKVNLVVVETSNNFEWRVFPVEGDYLRAGIQEFKRLLTHVIEWKEKI